MPAFESLGSYVPVTSLRYLSTDLLLAGIGSDLIAYNPLNGKELASWRLLCKDRIHHILAQEISAGGYEIVVCRSITEFFHASAQQVPLARTLAFLHECKHLTASKIEERSHTASNLQSCCIVASYGLFSNLILLADCRDLRCLNDDLGRATFKRL